MQNAVVTASEPCPICPTVPHFSVWSPNARSSGQLPSSRCEPVNLSTRRFASMPFEAPDLVERRDGLSRLKDVAETSVIVAQAQDAIRKYRAQPVEGGPCANRGADDCIADRHLVGIPFGGALEIAFGYQGFQPSLGIPGVRVVAEIGDDVRVDDGVGFDAKAGHDIGFVVLQDPGRKATFLVAIRQYPRNVPSQQNPGVRSNHE